MSFNFGFGAGPGISEGANKYVTAVTTRFETVSPNIKYAIYALLGGIIIATLVILVDNAYPFLPMNPISGPSPAARAGKTFWKDGGENLVVTTTDSPTVLPDNYMMSIQMMIGDSRSPNLGKYRHVVHRGNNPCGLPQPSVSGPSGPAGIQLSDLTDADPDYKESGLPSLMNPGLFLDKYKNDLHVFVHTTTSGNGDISPLLESLTIEDIPLATPITIGIACTGRTLEVYVNCRLYSTKILTGSPILPPADNQWFGRACAFPMSGLVKNLRLWSASLGASDYMQVCNGASFNTNDLPTTCATANDSCSDSSTFGSVKSLVSGDKLTAAQEKTLLFSSVGALL